MSIQNPILLDLPMPIVTDRLIIRPLMPGDGKQLFALLNDSREEFMKWFNWMEGVKSWEDTERTAREFYSGFIVRKIFCFLVFKNEKLVGAVSFNNPDWAIPSAEIGYYLHVAEQGKGYAIEAVTAIVHYGFHQVGFKRLEILCDEENTRSSTLAEKLGFALEVKALGITSVPRASELRMGRCYVRFSADGLDSDKIKW